MKKVLLIIGAFIVAGIIGIFVWYNLSLGAVSKKSREVNFTIDAGTSTKQVIDNLVSANLIKNKYAAYIYAKLNKCPIQAGTYTINQNMNLKSILDTFKKADSSENTIRITFVEGMRFNDYLKKIASSFDWNEQELVQKASDKEFLQKLINDYWFIDDAILNEKLYYPLEGYVFPDTYDFYKTATFEEVIEKMIKQMEVKLDPLKEEIKNSKYSPHELLTIASIAEKEAINSSDRNKVTQVIYKRLDTHMNLGMDVTTYYGVRKDMKEDLSPSDLNNSNPYNTRRSDFLGLPAGPICSPSITSIEAALEPADTNYTYFFADVKTGQVYFTSDYNEFLTFKEIYG